MPLKTFEDHASIVLVGNFNPAIFQPAWLAAKGLIRESEANAATIEVVHPEIAQFKTDWLHLSVSKNRFAATTTDPAHHAPLRDLVLSVFELLDQTPTSRMGLNRTTQLDLLDDETWHRLGHLLAPKEPWAEILEKPGMRALLLEGQRKDGLPGRTFIRVEPSQKYAHSIFIDVNSEFHVEPSRSNDPTAYFVSRIRDDWARIMFEAQAAIEKLVSQVFRKEDG